MFAKYYPPEAREPPLSLDINAGRLPQAPARPSAANSTPQQALVWPIPCCTHQCRACPSLCTLACACATLSKTSPCSVI